MYLLFCGGSFIDLTFIFGQSISLNCSDPDAIAADYVFAGECPVSYCGLSCSSLLERSDSTMDFSEVASSSQLFFSSTTKTALLVIALVAFTNERRSLFYPLLVREDLKQR